MSALAPYVTLPVASAAIGLTVKAMRRKIEDGKWLEGEVWRKAPDGHVMISIEGYRRWVESAAPGRVARATGQQKSGFAAEGRPLDV